MKQKASIEPQDPEEPGWAATEAQKHFIACGAYEVGLLGERASGKTDGLLMEPIVTQYGPARQRYEETGKKSRGWVLYLRKEFSRLREVIERAKELFPKLDPDSLKWPGYGWIAQERTYRFTCGFRYEFGHLEDPDSHHIYHGRQFSRVICDEAPEVPFNQYIYMFSCIRTKKGDEPYLEKSLGIRVGGNPYGTYVDWVKKRFVDACRPNEVLRYNVRLPDGTEAVRTRVYIPARIVDNPHIDYASYASSLADLPEPMKRAFLYGDWGYVAGSYFPDWNPQIHVRDNLEPTEGAEIRRGGDWGTRNPACCLWYMVDGDGNIIVLDEMYGPGITGEAWADRGLAHEERRGWTDTSGHLDPEAWQQHGSAAPSPGDDMLAKGWLWYPSDKSKGSVMLACVEMTRRLRMRSPTGLPGIIIDSRCKNLIKQIPMVRSKEDNLDEIEDMRDDHAFEAARAILLSNPVAPESRTLDVEVRRWERIVRAQNKSDRKRAEWY